MDRGHHTRKYLDGMRRARRTLMLAGMIAVALLSTGPGPSSVLFVAPASAQEVVTLALVNGERPSGELVDLNAKGFLLRVGGQDKYFAADDVAAIEFVVGAPSTQAVAALDRGQAVVVLRSGQLIEGRLTDVGGTRPLRLTVDTASGSRDLRSNEVAQIHLRKTGQAAQAAIAATAGSGDPATTAGISVPANAAWTETSVIVTRGDRVRFVSRGDIMVASGASAGVAGAGPEIKAQGQLPISNASVGALIGRIGSGRPFLIGANDQPIPMTAIGRLYLGINDDHVADNTGAFTVSVTKVPR